MQAGLALFGSLDLHRITFCNHAYISPQYFYIKIYLRLSLNFKYSVLKVSSINIFACVAVIINIHRRSQFTSL